MTGFLTADLLGFIPSQVRQESSLHHGIPKNPKYMKKIRLGSVGRQ
jgi:hypothetical protein